MAAPNNVCAPISLVSFWLNHLMEHIEKAGAEAGLSQKLTREIGAQTLLGAAKMLLESPEDTAVLKDNIT